VCVCVCVCECVRACVCVRVCVSDNVSDNMCDATCLSAPWTRSVIDHWSFILLIIATKSCTMSPTAQQFSTYGQTKISTRGLWPSKCLSMTSCEHSIFNIIWYPYVYAHVTSWEHYMYNIIWYPYVYAHAFKSWFARAGPQWHWAFWPRRHPSKGIFAWMLDICVSY
jgi:hypothetical protein